MRRFGSAFVMGVLLWWVLYDPIGASGLEGLVKDRIDGPYNDQQNCVDAARWYNRHKRTPSEPNGLYVCRWIKD